MTDEPWADDVDTAWGGARCETCNGPIIHNYARTAWLHVLARDWRDAPHNATPAVAP